MSDIKEKFITAGVAAVVSGSAGWAGNAWTVGSQVAEMRGEVRALAEGVRRMDARMDALVITLKPKDAR